MKIYPDYISEPHEEELWFRADADMDGIPEKKNGGRNRILRFGWDYSKPDKWLVDIPDWLPMLFENRIGNFGYEWDSITINEYLREQRILPHIDSPKFGDVAILSLLADVTMRFTSTAGEIRDFVLPRRSLAVMSGELRTKWMHETEPLADDRRISIVYRRKI